MKPIFCFIATSFFLVGCESLKENPTIDSATITKENPSKISQKNEPEPVSTTSIRAKAGLYQHFETDLELDEKNSLKPFYAEFKVGDVYTAKNWNPAIYFCIRGQSPSAVSCVGAVKYNDEKDLRIVERFIPAPGVTPINIGSNLYVSISNFHAVEAEFVKNEVVFKIDGRVVYSRDIGKKPEHILYSCSSMHCDVTLFSD